MTNRMLLLMVLLTINHLKTNAFSLLNKRIFQSVSKSRSKALKNQIDDTVDVDYIGDSTSSPSSVDSSFSFAYGLPISIYIDYEIIKFCQLPNSRRKIRWLLTKNIQSNDLTEEKLRAHIEKTVFQLSNKPYILRYVLPGLIPQRFQSDEDVLKAFTARKRMQLFVQVAPGIFPPPSKPYLENMADPADTDSFTMTSFYRFDNIPNPDEFKEILFELWRPFKVFGRVYVAKEGINAQMSIPSNVFDNFRRACDTLSIFKDLYLNVDHRLSREEFYSTQPFKSLHIRVRDQIVADGWDYSLNWEKSGKEINSTIWNAGLSNPGTIVLDCRNSYESDVGIFEKAIPLNTTYFRESWDALDEILQDVPKDAPIMTYCTGGIRCVKINAYLEQKRGFTNVSRLAGGIISYVKEIQQNTLESTNITTSIHLERDVQSSKFKGMNYVFDERMGARITKDVLATCETCGDPFDIYTNCASTLCHVRFIQCKKCSLDYNGCCCKSCQKHYENMAREMIRQQQNMQMLPRGAKQSAKNNNSGGTKVGQKASLSRVLEINDDIALDEAEDSTSAPMTPMIPHHSSTTIPATTTTAPVSPVSSLISNGRQKTDRDRYLDALAAYCDRHTSSEPVLLNELRSEVMSTYNEGAARMICSHVQGRLLVSLCSLMKAKDVLELGTFTGYSALCFAEGITSDGKVLTCDIDDSSVALAQTYFAKSPVGHKIEQRIAKASDLLTECYSQGRTFDVVFIDADKKAYLEYLKRVLNLDGKERAPLVNDGALLIVDNTLWKGLVLAQEEDLREYSPHPAEYGNADRMRGVASSIHEFNRFVASHPQLETVMLPLRDGLTIVRYNAKK